MVLLSRREHSRAELREKLTGQGYQAEIVDEALDGLEAERLLDDSRFSESFVRAHAARGQGPRRIRQELSAAGIAADLAEQALEEGPDWGLLARETRRRKFGEDLPPDWAERGRQARFLQYRGFSTDHIRIALGGSEADLDLDPDP
jgi:regulatory protein